MDVGHDVAGAGQLRFGCARCSGRRRWHGCWRGTRHEEACASGPLFALASLRAAIDRQSTGRPRLAGPALTANGPLERTTAIDTLYRAGPERSLGHFSVEGSKRTPADTNQSAAALRGAAVVPRGHAHTVRVGRAGQIKGVRGERARARIGLRASGCALRQPCRREADKGKRDESRGVHRSASEHTGCRAAPLRFIEPHETRGVPDRTAPDVAVAAHPRPRACSAAPSVIRGDSTP
jgi:hypothetical protein